MVIQEIMKTLPKKKPLETCSPSRFNFPISPTFLGYNIFNLSKRGFLINLSFLVMK